MVSLRSRLVEVPAATIKTSTVDHSAHEGDDGQPRSMNHPSSGELSEHSQLMMPVETDVPSLLDIALASSGGPSTDVDVDQGELNGSEAEEAEEAGNSSDTANEIMTRLPADFPGVIVEDDTASCEDEINNTYQSLPQSSSTVAASFIELTEGQLHLTSSSGQANCSAQLKRKRSIDEIETGRNLVSAIDSGEDSGDARPRAYRRKLRKLSVRGYGGAENLWMGNTLEGIEAVIKGTEDAVELLAEQSDILDAFGINGEIEQLLGEQKGILVALKDYILACGAKEAKITKRWETSE